MWKDPVVEEVRKVRDAHAAQFNYELRAIYRALKNEEAGSGRKFVRLPSACWAQEATDTRSAPSAALTAGCRRRA